MASQVTKGITVTFRGDTVEFDKSVGVINKELKELKKEYTEVNKQLKYDPTNLDLINKKQEALMKLLDKSKEKYEVYKAGIEATTDKIDQLTKAQNRLTESAGGVNKLNEEELKKYKEIDYEIEQLTNALHNEQKALATVEKAVDSYDRQLQNFKGKQISSVFKDQSEKANLLAQSIGEVARQTAILSAGATAGLGAMVKSAGDFEQQWLAVQKVLKPQGSGANNTKSWDEILAEIKTMASTLPVSIDTIMQTFANSAQLGIANDNLQEFVETMLRLDSATNITADEASIKIAQLYNIMGADIKNVDNFANALVRLGNTSATTEADILEMSSTLAGSATNVGFTEYQVLALADALASMGLNSASAGSSISTILTKIDKEVAKTNKALEDGEEYINDWAEFLGVTGEQFSKMWSENASDTFVQIIGALRDGREAGENLNLALNDLGITNIRQDRSVKALVNSYELLKKQMIESENAFYKGTDAIDESDRAWSSFNSSIQLLKNNLKLLAMEFGNQILPVLNPMVNGLKNLVKRFSQTNSFVKTGVVILMSLLAVLSPLLFMVSGLIKSFANVNGLLAKLALTFTPFFEKTLMPFINTFKSAPIKTLISGLLSPVGLLIAGITALVAGFLYCWDNMEGFREEMTKVWESISTSLLPIFSFLINVLKDLWFVLKESLSPAFQSFMFIIGDLWKLFGGVISIVAELIGVIFNALQPLLEGLAFFLETVLYGNIALISNAIALVVDSLADVIDFASRAIDKILELLGLREKVGGTTTHFTLDDIEHGGSGGNRTFGSGGLGINTSGLNFQSGGVGAITLHTAINVNNNGVPINDSLVRSWANTITDIVSENLGRRL